ncbi:MAG TPA: hypothetical protein VGT05_03435 [Patescibacteria group bacterium]|nr:hypothetical protein [Patescibacteria group bacterium]
MKKTSKKAKQSKRTPVVKQKVIPYPLQVRHPERVLLLLLCSVTIAAICFLLVFSKSITFHKSKQTPSYLFSGKVSKISQDLHLLQTNTTTVTYYSAGVYAGGEYKNYERIVAVVANGDVNNGYVFATKNRKTFVIDTQSAQDIMGEDLYHLNKQVNKTDFLPTDEPKVIMLNKQFSLYREGVVTNGIQNTTELFSPEKDVRFFFQKDINTLNYLLQNPTSQLPDAYALFQSYIGGTTEVLAMDRTGLVFRYNLSNAQNIQTYETVSAAYQETLKMFYAQMRQGKNIVVTLPPFPSPPSEIFEPNLHLTKAQITTTQSVYDSYAGAMPDACSDDASTIIAKNVYDKDVTQIGSAEGFALFALTNKQHPLYQLAYFMKVSSFPDLFWQNESALVRPTFDAYVQKNPLLLLKDYWGRWVVLGEHDYQLQGGCG